MFGKMPRFVSAMEVGSLAMLVVLIAGCPQYADPSVPNPIRQQVEPSHSGKYLVYTPTGYDGSQAVPLVILCHGTTPWDTPQRQIRDWVKIAENETFVVAAPFLKGTRGDLAPSASRQIKLQRDDERTILGVVRHVRAAHRIQPDRIFMSGWSAGNFAVLYTGLKHPELFRALAVLQGNFDEEYLTDLEGDVDPYQPIFVLYGTTDLLTGKQGKACVDWLYGQGAYVFDYRVSGPHRAHPRRAFDFFSRVVRQVPWLHLRWTTPELSDPFTVQLSAHGSFTPRVYDWDFGDGETSPIAAPIHTYTEPGQYTITLRAKTPDDRRIIRKLTLNIPARRVDHDLIEYP